MAPITSKPLPKRPTLTRAPAPSDSQRLPHDRPSGAPFGSCKCWTKSSSFPRQRYFATCSSHPSHIGRSPQILHHHPLPVSRTTGHIRSQKIPRLNLAAGFLDTLLPPNFLLFSSSTNTPSRAVLLSLILHSIHRKSWKATIAHFALGSTSSVTASLSDRRSINTKTTTPLPSINPRSGS